MRPDIPSTGQPRLSRAQQVAAEIEGEILSERLPGGTRLGLRTELITRYDVSPPVMNEALRILRERDLITVRPGRGGGVMVASPPPQLRLGGIDVWHQGLTAEPEKLFEARAQLDLLLTMTAARRATPEDIRAMEWALDEMRAAGQDAKAFLNANMRLHLAVARASRVHLLADFYESIVTLLSATMTKATFVEDTDELLEHNLQVHANLIIAIRDQDTIALQKLLSLHHLDTIRIT